MKRMLEFVGEWQDKVDHEIFNALEGDNPQLWELGREYPGRGGKRLRPAMVLLGAREAGGSEDEVVRLAASVELLHNFTLIHDDIEDASEFRRGAKCLHLEHGVPLAINAGDALFAKSFQLAGGYGHGVPERFAEVMCTIAEGQDLDIRWGAGEEMPTEEEYVDMVRRKTGALLGFSLEGGHMAAGGGRNAELAGYGESLGVAFQIIDDVLGVAGDPGKTGKDVDKDILEGKKTLPVLKAAEGDPQLLELLSKGSKGQGDVAAIREAIRESGALEYSRDRAKEFVDGARYPFKDELAAECMESLENFIIERKF